MSEIKLLINAVRKNTEAQKALANNQKLLAESQMELAKAINELAASNRDMVDYLVGEESEEGKDSTHYMDGQPKEQYL